MVHFVEEMKKSRPSKRVEAGVPTGKTLLILFMLLYASAVYNQQKQGNIYKCFCALNLAVKIILDVFIFNAQEGVKLLPSFDKVVMMT